MRPESRTWETLILQWLLRFYLLYVTMNTLKELVNNVYTDLQKSDWINQYPELTEKSTVSDILQWITLDMMPRFVESSNLEKFVNESEVNYTETTFKKYINNYPEFLNTVEQEFYNGLLVWLTEM